MISHQKASARTVKGWIKRKAKSAGKKTWSGFTFAVGASALYTGYRTGSDHYRYLRHRKKWTRPNKEVIDVRGFTKGEYRHLNENALKKIDRRVRPEHKITVPGTHKYEIRKQHVPFLAVVGNFPVKIAGGTIPSKKEVWDEENRIRKELGYPSVNQETKRWHNRKLHLGGVRGHPKIFVTPSVVAHNQKHAEHVIVHEMAHAFDKGRKFSNSREWRRAAGWKIRSRNYGTGSTRQSRTDRTKGYKGGYYQSTSPLEDFAESFSKAMGYQDSRDPIVYDRKRQMYFNKYIFNEEKRNARTTVQRQRNLKV